MAANDALNHTLIRSLNTSLVAILPVAAILFIGTTLLGAGTLKDLSLALFVGMVVGTYSSLCVATPLLVTLKEREPKYQAIARQDRLHQRGQGRQGLQERRDCQRLTCSTSTPPPRSRAGASSCPAVPERARASPAAWGGESGPRGRSTGRHGPSWSPSGVGPAPEENGEERAEHDDHGAHPGRAGLPRAGRAVQGHHAPARRPRGVRGRGGRAGRAARGGQDRRHRGTRVHPGRPGRLPHRRRIRAGQEEGQTSLRRPWRSPTSWSTAPLPSRCTATRSRPATGS